MCCYEISSFIDQDTTNEIKDPGNKLTWLPFVGKDYQNQKIKLMLIGKSHYNWGAADASKKLEEKNFNIEAMIWNAIGVNRWNCEKISDFKNKRFQRGIERILLDPGFDEQKRDAFWKSIVFHQLIQNPMNNWRHNDNRQMRRDGWETVLELIKQLKPNVVLFFSNQWKYFADFTHVIDESTYKITSNETWGKVKNHEVRCIEYASGESKFKFCMIVHPSSRNSDSIEQSEFLKKATPEYFENQMP